MRLTSMCDVINDHFPLTASRLHPFIRRVNFPAPFVLKEHVTLWFTSTVSELLAF